MNIKIIEATGITELETAASSWLAANPGITNVSMVQQVSPITNPNIGTFRHTLTFLYTPAG